MKHLIGYRQLRAFNSEGTHEIALQFEVLGPLDPSKSWWSPDEPPNNARFTFKITSHQVNIGIVVDLDLADISRYQSWKPSKPFLMKIQWHRRPELCRWIGRVLVLPKNELHFLQRFIVWMVSSHYEVHCDGDDFLLMIQRRQANLQTSTLYVLQRRQLLSICSSLASSRWT